MTPRRTVPGTPAGAGRLPLADAAWLEPLLDAGAMRRALADAASPLAGLRVSHVRYRPGASCTVAYEALPADGQEAVSLYARALAPGRGRPPCADAEAGARPTGRVLPGPVPLEDGRVVVREFPRDATMPQLAIVADPARLTRLVAAALGAAHAPGAVSGTFTRLRYKAEHRLILRADLRWPAADGDDARERICQVRFEYDVDREARRRTREVLAELLPSGAALLPPGAETVVPDAGCSVVAWRPGRDLSRDLLKARPGAVAVAARALATLATLPADRFAHLPLRLPDGILATLAAQADVLRDHPPAPGTGDRIGRICDRLGRIAPRAQVGLVHGDFHQGQVLVDGGTVSLLDWDRSHRGDPARDRGRFLAQVHLLDVRGRPGAADLTAPFRAALADAGADPVSSRRETFWTVTALAELALRELRRLRADWPERTDSLLDRCESLLDREGVA